MQAESGTPLGDDACTGLLYALSVWVYPGSNSAHREPLPTPENDKEKNNKTSLSTSQLKTFI